MLLKHHYKNYEFVKISKIYFNYIYLTIHQILNL